ncbi:MAG: undecaprenyldiphospho-muramoylpentapeptide beta-N-acetylglucosaminyltransferase [Caldisericia bacterium]|nr:undecaprenyldiphospho-muramoylpentapeptide beta-N-acetylglucosaminyltransferase [Caldisericia bacterium]
MKRIVLTGGGTAGHVIPNIALIPELIKNDWSIHYIGQSCGIEHRLIEEWNMRNEYNVQYHSISCGKFRRNLSFKNISDLNNIRTGYKECLEIFSKFQPDILFSKGGFVSVPPAYAARKKNIPIITHESDISSGLANKMINRIADKTCLSFPTKKKTKKLIYTGNPVRRELLNGTKKKGLKFCDFNDKKPVILVMGGSQGSTFINDLVTKTVPYLLCKFQIIHLTGKNNCCEVDHECYKGIEFAGSEMPDIYACADVVISRAGANSLFELLALKKPMILIPLPKKYSRGDQILNAKYFSDHGYSDMLLQKNITTEKLIDQITYSLEEKDRYEEAMSKASIPDSIKMIVDLLNEYSL